MCKKGASIIHVELHQKGLGKVFFPHMKPAPLEDCLKTYLNVCKKCLWGCRSALGLNDYDRIIMNTEIGFIRK